MGLERLFRSWDGGVGPRAGAPQLHFCPDGRDALLVLTDHGDRTHLGPTTALYLGHSDLNHPTFGKRGILSGGVRITQGTFWSGYPEFDYLDDSRFLELMRRVAKEQSEVCPHNTSENLLNPDATRKDLHRFADEFGLTTFIDHGHLPSNLFKQGADPTSPHFILDVFKRLGGTAAWTFEDVTTNPPPGQIDMLHPPRRIDYIREAIKATWHRAQGGQAPVRARYAAFINDLIGSPSVYHLLGAIRGRQQPRVAQVKSGVFATLRHLRYRSHRRGAFPFRWDGEMGLVLFDTSRINLITKTYTRSAIERLIAAKGVHVGHTYLGLITDRHGDLPIERDENGWRTREGFEDFLSAVRCEVKNGRLWNPTIREVVGRFQELSACSLETVGRIVRVRNQASAHVRGLTIRSPDRLDWSMPCKEIDQSGEWWYVLDLDVGEAAEGRRREAQVEG